MILKVTDKTGDVVVDTVIDGTELAQEWFAKAVDRQMWGKGTKNGKSEFLPTNTPFEDILEYDEVVMLPQQVGG